ncbi:hypothetical protein GCM10023170_054710 [Phytohabitans houttuyneae]|uniref:Uncharacterized protein n=1 Tax=Phytohabitans houttuyneae TaxID=1076126 RepID=A0A6V8KAG7_9ACTN|nr:hypothetical protein Phou_064130 [Phytohabitans houttuyneae]
MRGSCAASVTTYTSSPGIEITVAHRPGSTPICRTSSIPSQAASQTRSCSTSVTVAIGVSSAVAATSAIRWYSARIGRSSSPYRRTAASLAGSARRALSR